MDVASLGKVCNGYAQFLHTKNMREVEAEINLWKEKCQTYTETLSPPEFLAKYSNMMRTQFPNILLLIRLLCTLPVSTSSAERAFSLLNRIFTEKRTTMSVDRLSDLSILSFYSQEARDLDLNLIVNAFKNLKPRRARF